ncbi:MAG: carboxypeptidase regulatory-like domain-containing protein, partial [Opitutaceae bacterium]
MKRKNPLAIFGSWLALALAPEHATQAADSTSASASQTSGAITGAVSNAASRNLLEGAQVTIPALGVGALTDNTGRYVLIGVPSGTHEIVASYTGLDPVKAQVTVGAGQRATHDFDLTSGIYQLDAFKVTGEREGNASAITAQRNAPNVKNVVAIDAFGNLPNMNASELAVLLPGVAGNLSDEGNIVGFTIRGMGPGFNTITIDGALMGSQNGANRQTRIHNITGSMFDSLELTKGHRPDQGMDSLGGTVNLKSRSPLSMTEKRRVSYNLSARLAHPGKPQTARREDHPIHPLLNVAYQEVFGVFGGERNLGVALNLFYSEQVIGMFSTARNFQNTTSQPAYLWDYTTADQYNNRKQSSVNAKFDYRLSASTRISLNMIYNDAFERFLERHGFRAFAGNANTVPGATSGIVPGFTSRVTEVRAVAGSNMEISSSRVNWLHRQRHVDLGVEHEFGPLRLDYNVVRSIDRINSGNADGGSLVNRTIAPVGWIIDRTQSDLYPRIIQTAGPDITKPASYLPASYNFSDNKAAHEVAEARANARYKLPTEVTLYIKTGARWREEFVGDKNKSRRYLFTGAN